MRQVANAQAAPSDIPFSARLRAFAEAVVRQDADAAEALRRPLIDDLGCDGFVDVCAVIAAFHGFTRVADATGIEVEEMRAETAKFVETEMGIADPAKRAPARA